MLSSDPRKQANQLANLRRGPDASVTHGTRSEVVLAPLRQQAERWALDRCPGSTTPAGI
jgi:hypothetical protein